MTCTSLPPIPQDGSVPHDIYVWELDRDCLASAPSPPHVPCAEDTRPQVFDGTTYVDVLDTFPGVVFGSEYGASSVENGFTVSVSVYRESSESTWDRIFDFGEGAGIDNMYLAFKDVLTYSVRRESSAEAFVVEANECFLTSG